MSKRMRGIVTVLTLVVFCAGMFSTSMINQSFVVSAQEAGTNGRFLKVEAEVRGVGEGLISFYDGETERSGFFDMDGNIAIPARYAHVGTFREGLASAGVSSYATGYIDDTGRFVIPPVFDWGMEFNRGKAIVYSRGTGCQIIDTTAATLLEKTYDSIFYDKQFRQYFAYDGKNTDVLDDDLQLLYTFPYMINTVQQVDGRPFGIFIGDDPQSCGAIDLHTGKVIVKEESPGYAMIQNGFLYTNSEEKQTSNIYSLDDGALLAEFGMESVFPINQNTFYTNSEGTHFIIKNGAKREVDYMIYTEVLPGLLLVATDPNLDADGQIRYGVMDKDMNMLLPAVYDSICGDYRNYSTGVNASHIFITQKGNICEVYDARRNKLATYQDIAHCGFTGELYYLVDSKGSTMVLNNTGNYLGTLNTSGIGIEGGWENVLADYSQNPKMPQYYVYIDEAISRKSANTYDPDTHPSALSLADVEAHLTGAFFEPESFFTTSRFAKNDSNGNISLHRNWVPTPTIIDGRTYIHPSEIIEAFSSFGYRIRPDQCELSYQDKTLRLTYGKKEATMTYYDAKARSIAENVIILEAPVLALDKLTGNMKGLDATAEENLELDALSPDDEKMNGMDAMAFVPLRAAAEALGLSVSWQDGLIGVSNRPVMLSAKEAAEKKAFLDNMLFDPASLNALDASLATQPYVDKLVKETLGITEMWDNICEYTNTIPGYEALIAGTKDIILVTEPSKEMLALAASKGVELEITPFAKEGFVFLLNKSNPVDTLTVQQIKNIYAGKITNWKEVGGPDAPVLAYQRNESSGSQTIMENVFMKDETLMDPLTERRVMSMAGLVDVIAEFTGEVNHSIGYSVYYYATQMYGNDMVKLVKVDGVLPDSATIADDTYPVVVNYFIVTRKGDMTPFAKQMKDYVLSPAGQKLLTDVGLVPIDE